MTSQVLFAALMLLCLKWAVVTIVREFKGLWQDAFAKERKAKSISVKPKQHRAAA